MAVVEQSTSLASDSTFAAFDAALAGARESFEAGLDRMRSVPDSLLVKELDRLEQRVAAERLLAVARLAGSSGDVGIDRRRARSTMSDTSQSGRSVNRDARRAAIVAANDRLGEQLANGSIAPDSIDALAKAADDASGRLPEELVDAVEGLAADQAGRVVQDHLEAVADASEVEDRYQRQYESRRSYRYNSPAINGRPVLSGIAIKGADADVDRLWSMIRSRADAAYTAAGGRDAPKASHRSFEQRLFDSLDEALAGNSSGIGGGRPAVIVTVRRTTSCPGHHRCGGALTSISSPCCVSNAIAICTIAITRSISADPGLVYECGQPDRQRRKKHRLRSPPTASGNS